VPTRLQLVRRSGIDLYTALPYSKSVRLTRTSRYARWVAKLLPYEEQLAMELHIIQNPEAFPVIAGAGGSKD